MGEFVRGAFNLTVLNSNLSYKDSVSFANQRIVAVFQHSHCDLSIHFTTQTAIKNYQMMSLH